MKSLRDALDYAAHELATDAPVECMRIACQVAEIANDPDRMRIELRNSLRSGLIQLLPRLAQPHHEVAAQIVADIPATDLAVTLTTARLLASALRARRAGRKVKHAMRDVVLRVLDQRAAA